MLNEKTKNWLKTINKEFKYISHNDDTIYLDKREIDNEFDEVRMYPYTFDIDLSPLIDRKLYNIEELLKENKNEK